MLSKSFIKKHQNEVVEHLWKQKQKQKQTKKQHFTVSLPKLDMTKAKEEMSLFHTFHHLNSNALVTA